MAHSDHFIRLFDSHGNLHSVVMSGELWQKYQHKLDPILRNILQEMEPVERDEPLQEWDEFKQYWDFKYPYEARVECGCCGKTTEDWTLDPEKPFTLRSAGLGGLLVFNCNKCNALIRKKHFKDHICYEFDK